MSRIFALALVTIISISCISLAQISHFAPTNPDSSLHSILDSLEGTHLSLHEAVESALKNATSVRTAEASYIAARGTSRKEAGYFDPQFFFTFNRSYQEQPTASFFSGTSILTSMQNNASGGLRMNLPIGTSIEASLNTIKLESNSPFSFLNPQYSAFGNLSLRQPLLRGLFISANKNSVKADQELDAAKARYDQEILAMSTQVEQGYWDLYAAERDYAVQKLTRDRAESFLMETETRAKTGLIGPNQVASARTFMAEQEIFLLDREEQLDQLSDRFSSLIGKRPEIQKPRFITIDDPPADFPVEDINGLVEHAMQTNLTLQAARADVESKRALSRASFWEALPKIDLVGSIGGNGLAGSVRNDTLPTTWVGAFGDAMNQAIKREFKTWSIGVEISVPILLRSGLGENERLEAELIIAEQRRIHQERILQEQVRASCRELFNGERRLKAAREGVNAAQEQVRIGLIEFQNGRSTAFELVRLGADFAIAQQRYTQALVRSAKAAANLRQLTSGFYPSN